MTNVQPLLVGGNGAVTDLRLVVSESSDCILVFPGTAVLERVRCSREALEYKMLIGRLVNAGWSPSRLQKTFGHDPRTMKRWAAALLSDDVAFAIRAFSGRGSGGKLTPPMVRYIKRRYGELRGLVRDYRALIGAEVADLFATRVSGETLRKVFREADRERNEGGDGAPDGPGRAPGMATDCASDPAPGSDTGGTHNQSPDSPRGPLPGLRGGAWSYRTLAVHHAGMILFALALELFCRRRPWAVGRQTQWIGQVLQGAVNLEQSRLITPDDLARFTGPVLAGIEAQRTALDRVAGPEAVMDIYAANARLLSDGPGRAPGVLLRSSLEALHRRPERAQGLVREPAPRGQSAERGHDPHPKRPAVFRAALLVLLRSASPVLHDAGPVRPAVPGRGAPWPRWPGRCATCRWKVRSTANSKPCSGRPRTPWPPNS